MLELGLRVNRFPAATGLIANLPEILLTVPMVKPLAEVVVYPVAR